MSAGPPLWPHQVSYRLERARRTLSLVEWESHAHDWLVSLKPLVFDVERQRRSVNASMRWATWKMVEQAQEHGWHLSPEAFRAFLRTDARRLEEQRVISSIVSNASSSSLKLSLKQEPDPPTGVDVSAVLGRVEQGIRAGSHSEPLSVYWNQLRTFVTSLPSVSREAAELRETLAWLSARRLEDRLPPGSVPSRLQM